MDHFNSKHRIVDAIKCEALCSCRGRHEIPATEVMSALNAYDELAKNCVKAYGQASVLLLDDENTHKAASVRVLELLQEYSQPCHHIKLVGDTIVTDQLVKSIYEQSAGNALIIAVGAGSINDLGKYVAGKREIPFDLRKVPSKTVIKTCLGRLSAIGPS